MGSESVTIKGKREGLLILLNPNFSFEEIRTALQLKMEKARGFFQGARFSLLPLHHGLTPQEKEELEKLCQAYGLVPLKNPPLDFSLPTRTPFLKAPGLLSLKTQGLFSAETRKPTFLSPSLRAGQIFAVPGNAVVLGNVHPGGEVSATGNVIVTGSLCGTAWSGKEGDTQAFIFAYYLAPLQLRIASLILPGEKEKRGEGPWLSRVEGEKIVTRPYYA